VHGWEDEFHEVRHATVQAVCRLGLPKYSHTLQKELNFHMNDRNQAAATQSNHETSSVDFVSQYALDVLADLFNDDVDFVRIASILGIKELGNLICFVVFYVWCYCCCCC
jgi:ABC-type transport system involved in Fe-S cluster assembly fused permease/ATPase subunit